MKRRRKAQPLDLLSDQPRPGPAGSAPTGDPSDLIADILARVREAGEVDDQALARIEVDIRRDWGGERCYIAKQGEHAKAVQSARDECIRRDYRRGERLELLCRRYGLSARRVQEIVSQGRAA